MASIETSTTGLSGAVPAAGGRGKRRAAGILGYVSIIRIHIMYSGARDRSPAALGGVGTVTTVTVGHPICVDTGVHWDGKGLSLL